jgi:tetratricopeptide (TPR) repeat protein
MLFAGGAKLTLGADEQAVAWLRRSIEINRTFPLAHFFLAAALANLGKLDEARAETRVGLTFDSTFTIQRFRGLESDNPIFLAGKERIVEGMRKSGVPEG